MLDPNFLEAVTLFMLMLAAFTNGIVGEDDDSKDAEALLEMGGGKGFMFWALLLTIGAVVVPVTWEFACAETGVICRIKHFCVAR